MRIFKVIFGFAFLLLMALMPLKLSQFLGRCLGKYFYRAKKSRSYKVSQKNIDLCFPELTDTQRQQLLYQSLLHTGMSYAEMGMSWLWPTAMSLKKILSVEGEDLLREASAQGKGVIIIAPHIGNWEILNLYTSRHYALTVLYKPPKLKFFDWLINKMRKRLGGDTAPANGAGVRKLMKKLKTKGIVGILPDQEPADGSGQFVPFFNRPAYTMTLLSQLAAKTQCIVVSGMAIRADHGAGFHIKFQRVGAHINSKSLDSSLLALNQCVEDIAKSYPEQYQWEYKRFRKKPDV